MAAYTRQAKGWRPIPPIGVFDFAALRMPTALARYGVPHLRQSRISYTKTKK
jgi:hypothetical protein